MSDAVLRESELSMGGMQVVEFAGKEVLVAKTSAGIFAVDNMCSHAAERLANGKLKGFKLFCPLHGAAFDIRDGSALSRPAKKPLATYGVRLENGEIYLSVLEEDGS